MSVDKIILGTVQLGLDYGINNTTGKPGAEEAFKILHTAYDHGIRKLDTAEGYGESQRVIGEFHRRNPEKRFQILTKFKSGPGQFSLHEQFKKSSEELFVKKFYSYSFHQFSDLKQPELTDELQALKGKGLIEKIGASVYGNEELQEAIEARALDVIQLPFNLLDNLNRRGELLREAKLRGKEIHVRSVFLQGIFYRATSTFPEKIAGLIPYVKRIKELAQKHKTDVTTLSLRYATDCFDVDQVLIGVEKNSQLLENLRCLGHSVDPAAYLEVNSISAPTELIDPRNWK